MGVDLRVYLVGARYEDRWWCDSAIALQREQRLWDRISLAKLEKPVCELIEVYTYGADGNTKFVLDKNSYGERITYASAQRFGRLLSQESAYSFNARAGDLLLALASNAVVALYWH